MEDVEYTLVFQGFAAPEGYCAHAVGGEVANERRYLSRSELGASFGMTGAIAKPARFLAALGQLDRNTLDFNSPDHDATCHPGARASGSSKHLPVRPEDGCPMWRFSDGTGGDDTRYRPALPRR